VLQRVAVKLHAIQGVGKLLGGYSHMQTATIHNEGRRKGGTEGGEERKRDCV